MENNQSHSSSCAEILHELSDSNFRIFEKHILELISQFNICFKDFREIEKYISFFANPLTAAINEKRKKFQLELCDLQTGII